ncbi:EAL domain-containing protein [Wenzhouxiangella sp. AB-CW3]|uniref:sensor domain-containing protein n=1 Tax=Wenzhouxiangella sp. AB-CW3 TaxID=2771012 RepID=UPI001CC2C933|nr:EAL domain-containing protein [Wenzhouxiangella sp. AB-CW3]
MPATRGLVILTGLTTAAPAWSAESASVASVVQTPLIVAVLGLLAMVSSSMALLLWRSLGRARWQASRIQRRLAQYENMAGNLPIGLHEVVDDEDVGPKFIYVNDRALELMGVSRLEAEEDLYAAFSNVHPDDHEQVLQNHESARKQNTPLTIEARFIVEGRQRWLRIESWPREVNGQFTWPGCTTDVTDRREAELQFRVLFEQSPLAIMLHDADTGEVLDANRQAWSGWGYDSIESFQAAKPHALMGPEYGEEQALEGLRLAARGGSDRFEWSSRHADGHVLWHHVTLTAILLSGRTCVLGVCLDITERRAAEHRLRESEAWFRRILQDVDGVSVQGYDADGQVRYWNRASEELYGYSAEEAIGENLVELIVPPEMREEVRQNLQRMLEGEDIENGELELMRKDGSRVPVYSSHTVLRRAEGEPELFCVDIDLSERKAHEDALDRMANYDALTGLPNRRLMGVLLEQMMVRARRAQSSFALCYLDLDDFKPINDAMGHEVGDSVLVEVGKRLHRLVRGSDLVARLGGDEFVLAMDSIGDGPELEKRLRFILDGISRPIELDGRHFQVSGSIGVTLFPQDDTDPDTLLRHADQAMYRAKAMGRNQFSLFDTEIEARVSEQRERLRKIEAGLEQGQFRLHFQPKVRLASGRVEGFEGLVRWHHPESGVLAPARFLPALDRTGLESRFGDYIIEQALQQLQHWLQGGLDLSLSVNISGPHLLSEGFVDRLQDLLSRYPDVLPERLEFEIVESAAVTHLERAVAVLLAVGDLGLQISLDDFGTGYSSLSHLRSLPVDEVKIDQSFVRDMLTDLNDYNIVRSVIGLAEAFGLRVVAEGVETPEHADALRKLGCEIVQGYAFARPMPEEEVSGWLSKHHEESS